MKPDSGLSSLVALAFSVVLADVEYFQLKVLDSILIQIIT